MKKPGKLCVILIISACPAVVFSQGFKAGFTLGIAATQVDGDTYGGFDKAGPVAGVWVGRNLGNSWLGMMELRYAQKGSYAKTTVNEFNGYYRMRLHYFELPVMGGYRFVNGFQTLGGISLGYLAKAEEMTELGPFPEEDISAFNQFELAMLCGVEYNYSEHWAFGAFFSYSIFPIRPYKGNITYRMNRGQYNQVVELLVRYKIQ
ncbi:MAG: PorT family protein [Bacteroidales bacterium]|nr:PorT family protein [Bacteroidales bacterium]HNT41752.1 porin family protein [Tenuifilaceae bacterium]HOC37282.1 porin family protein [Tenuifilaceae bacterium]HOG72921.1 porin family protein [Tenuifilaceae bacterium]HOY72714.1 porin family protein [Tenuifilaceae bacterium]